MISDILNESIETTMKLKKIHEFIDNTSEDILRKEISKLKSIKVPIKIKTDIYILIMQKYNSENIAQSIDLNIHFDTDYNIEERYLLLEQAIEIYKKNKMYDFFKHTIEEIVKSDDKILTHIFEYLINHERNKVDFGCELYKIFIKGFNISKVENIEFERDKLIKVCKKIPYIITVYTISSLKLFCKLDEVYLFTKEELDCFFKPMLFNYPYDCQRFIECTNDKNSYFLKYVNEYINDFQEKDKIKHSIKDILPSDTRINIYGKRKHKQAQEINKMSEKYSVFSNILPKKIILYGKNVYINQDNTNTSSLPLKDFSYCYNIPIEYSIDPVLFYNKIEGIIYDNDSGDKI